MPTHDQINEQHLFPRLTLYRQAAIHPPIEIFKCLDQRYEGLYYSKAGYIYTRAIDLGIFVMVPSFRYNDFSGPYIKHNGANLSVAKIVFESANRVVLSPDVTIVHRNGCETDCSVDNLSSHSI